MEINRRINYVKFHLFFITLHFLLNNLVLIFLHLMTENNKRRSLMNVEEDRVSDLPEHLIGSILDRLPIQEVVRTSILSKNWRYKWTTLTTLVLDEKFSNKFAKNGALGRNGFIRIINQVVLLNKGPISKFSLHIPKTYLYSFHKEVDEWMLFLSENSVRELTITNSSRRFELSSHVSSCSKLRKLSLENCILRPPLEFKSFSNLEDLYLKQIDFGAKYRETLVSLPQLWRLVMVRCTNIHNFNIEARKLNIFRIINLDAMYVQLLDWLLATPSITILLLFLAKPFKVLVGVERMNLTRMLSNLPNIRELTFSGDFLKFLTADKFPKWLPHSLNSLSFLWLACFELNDLDQFHGALCLLRNSPNLERLWMWSQTVRRDVGLASNHLESPDCLDQTLNRLQTVQIRYLKGSRPELLFIKLLLAHSPSLIKMTIHPKVCSSLEPHHDIVVGVMQFPRASPKAELIFVNC
ncbi:hypothetical protein OSB04_013229 [Centaurea solstitialis]|uniref:F-box domain-containing protein n=1 Tax=Centaurea solstitialis TaxID=347529 RepID=A0AA38TCU7_9ASTR|nr:hypothetical protein OSB04_013229 [Centaurea solstitialis]